MVYFIDRISNQKQREQIYGEKALEALYGNNYTAKTMGSILRFIAKIPLVSKIYGLWQKLPLTKKKILPFIQEYNIDASEFATQAENFSSFNDFFIRHLKKQARPIDKAECKAVLPADARYLVFDKINKSDHFAIKGLKYSLTELLGDDNLAKEYQDGSIVIARLCPTDYHRFHFPCDGIPSTTRMINGWLHSVNPMALAKNPRIFIENKRTITFLETQNFGKIIYMEIGATNVGSIIQTYHPEKKAYKGDEKGYFQFGGSTVILLFKKSSITFDKDLLNASSAGLETKGLMGQSLGKCS